MNDAKSVLRFEKYNIEFMEFKINDEYPFEEKEIELEFGFEAQVQVTEERDKAKTKLTCKVFDPDFKEKTEPFYLEITIVGYFSFNNGLGNIDDFRIHSVAILLPYLRAIITSFTSQTGIAPVIIPTINVFKLFENESEDE